MRHRLKAPLITLRKWLFDGLPGNRSDLRVDRYKSRTDGTDVLVKFSRLQTKNGEEDGEAMAS